MGFMLPTATDNGGRLAAILPTGLAALALGHSLDAAAVLTASADTASADTAAPAPATAGTAAPGPAPAASDAEASAAAALALLPPVTSLVVVAVDGLGSANLKARAGHAPTLNGMQQRRITTVTPSTTAAALTTLTTGTLPATHGLIGYRIMHESLGLLSPLRDWEGISDTRSWQRSEPLMRRAGSVGVTARAFGRPAHAESGLTGAILTGAEYIGGDRIEDRFAAAARQLATGAPTLAYIYVDELDRAGHRYGWQSAQWTRRLEQLDRALADFLTGLPQGTGVVVTADHGMVDIPAAQHIVFDLDSPEFAEVRAWGGEPRFRSLYLHDGADPGEVAARLHAREGKRAWVATRDEAFAAGVFGPNAPHEVRARVGDVILAARGQVAYYATTDDPQSFEIVGQHGSWTDEERGIPLIVGGAFAGSGFAKAVELVAATRTGVRPAG